MSIIELPDLLIANPNDLCTHEYVTRRDSRNGMVHLKMNVISFLQVGRKKVISNHQTSRIAQGEFLIMKSGKCLMSEKVAEEKLYHSTLLFFSDSRLRKCVEKHRVRVAENEKCNSHLVCSYDAYLTNWVSSVQDLAAMEEQLRRKLLEVKFDELMLYLFERKKIGGFFSSRLSSSQSEVHLKYVVENNALTNLTLKELSFISNMSVSTFKRKFQALYGSAPIKWFLQKRLEHAAMLLIERGAHSSEIYERAGFKSLSAFIKAFKKNYGLTPLQYQLRMKTEFSASNQSSLSEISQQTLL